ncbi:hypothetical protein [Anaerocolumna sedimenticola]|uniref:hypothetical protein n=1 Tax=Anaerocolumna sedimenticola TaxID=2696063 RepID=UPI001FE8F8E8|nr:hypothetical protein [Anaerocolumna sedimenticola]
MKDIPIYDTFAKIEPITKGMSGDQKYYIETIDGKHLLLRIADSSHGSTSLRSCSFSRRYYHFELS